MRRITCAAVTAVLACALVFSPGGRKAASVGATVTPRDAVEVEAFNLPGMPVNVTAAKAKKAEGKTVLSYSVGNDAGVSLDKLNLVVFIIQPDGRIRGGEGWATDTQQGQYVRVETPVTLEKQLLPGERLLVTLFRARSGAAKFEVSPEEVIRAVRSHLSGEASAPGGTRFVKAAAVQTVNPCIDAQSFAEKTCVCGVKSFSCNSTTGRYSFEAYYGPDSPKCPKTKPSPTE